MVQGSPMGMEKAGRFDLVFLLGAWPPTQATAKNKIIESGFEKGERLCNRGKNLCISGSITP